MKSLTIRGGNVNNRVHYLLLFFSVLFFLPAVCIAEASGPIGINLSSIRDWSSEMAFNDLFKRARHWISVDARAKKANNNHIEIDRDGWVRSLSPNQWVETYLFTDYKDHLPRLRYRCLYKGKGEIRFRNASVLADGHGWMDIQFDSDRSFVSMTITKSDPNNYIRNIRIIPLDAKGKPVTETFRDEFLQRWKSFSSIRYMNWQATAYNNQVHWSDRPTAEYFSWATKEKGVALEYMLELSNRLKISPWFCMPYTASDEYIRQFARMVKEKLDPSLKVHIEYSNEVWNRIFPSHRYAKKMGLKLGLSSDSNLAWARFYTHRSLQIFTIWQEEFGSEKRLVRVLAGQAVSPWWGKQILDWQDAYKKVDAFAVAPYFEVPDLRGLAKGERIPTMGELFSLLEKDIEAKKALVAEQKQLTRTRKISLIAYEGGQHLVAQNNPQLNDLYERINRHPGMYDLYKKYLGYWFQGGGGLFMAFSSVVKPGRSGHWGALEWYDQPVSPHSKYAALLDTLNAQ